MEDTVQVLQFPHPGTEHRAAAYVGSTMPWNSGDHARKFLGAHGRYLTDVTTSPVAADLGFWGEWEAPTTVEQLRARPAGQLPRWLHRADTVPQGKGHRQNTDPCVLGGFWYTNCRQLIQPRLSAHKRTQTLAPGSVILFGSRRDNGWVLDTVFVVGSSQRYSFDERPNLPEHVHQAVIEPLYSGGKKYAPFRAYSGATYDEPVDGMFSFVPAVPLDVAPGGFARPHIEHLGLDVNLSMAVGDLGSGPAAAQQMWKAVRDVVLGQDLALGIGMDAPVAFAGADAGPAHTSPGGGRPC